MRKLTLIILLLLQYTLLATFSLVTAAWLTGTLPVWCSPYNTIWLYITYVGIIIIKECKK